MCKWLSIPTFQKGNELFAFHESRQTNFRQQIDILKMAVSKFEIAEINDAKFGWPNFEF